MTARGRGMAAACAALLAAGMAGTAAARTVAAGTVAANPGATVSVPVSADGLAGVGAAVVVVGYDPSVVVCLGADAGAAVDAGAFTWADSGAGRLCAVVSGFAPGASEGGELLRVRFAVRAGTAGLFSDVALQDVRFGARDGVTDLSAQDPVGTVNGMVRSFAPGAAASRLEGAFTVWPETALGALALGAGDGIMASDAGRPVAVSGAVSAAGRVRVAAPPSGWRTGRYELLSTPTAGLAFDLADAPAGAAVVAETAGGVTTYAVDVVEAGAVEISDAGGLLGAAEKAAVREALADELAAHPAVRRVTVAGDVAHAALAADLGIAPAFAADGAEAVASYSRPSLSIVAFDPRTGRVRIRVSPGAGNAVVRTLATGCVHVYGSEDLSARFRAIPGTAFDLAPYLGDDTRGEADLTVALGSHSFIKVRLEPRQVKEGEEE